MKKIIIILLSLHVSLFTFHETKAQLIHVPSERSTIQEGINGANPGDTVLVADGTYIENINFLGKAITVASHFIIDGDTNHINNTIIDGSQPADPDYGSVVSFLSGEDTTSVLCGFTITGGTGMIESNYGARIGGGIACYNATAKIIHNRIIDNELNSSIYAWGGGIVSMWNTGYRWTVIRNNEISGNQCTAGTGFAEGAGIDILGNAWVCDNIIVDNHCICTVAGADGGGIYHLSMNYPADTIFLFNNTICNNTLTAATTARGGGVLIYSSYSIVQQNIISNNSMTGDMTNGCGILLRETTNAKVSNNVISHNSVSTNNIYWGVGCMFVEPAGQVYVKGNEFSYNTGPMFSNNGVGGGLAIMDAEMDNVLIDGNSFRHNTGRSGGGIYLRDCNVQKMTNNLFEANEAAFGGAVMIYVQASVTYPRPCFVNNTMTGNFANLLGGAAYLNCETNLPVFFNSIFYENTASEGNDIYYTGSPEPMIISYSDLNLANVTGPWTGEGNFNAPPGFIEGDTLFHLSLTSPCKNAGVAFIEYDGTTYGAPWDDIDGEGRPDPLYGGYDVGADEAWETPSAPQALEPEQTGPDYFVARWRSVGLAMGYRLDVAFDAGFSQMVQGYENFDAGPDTTAMVSGLEALTYYYRVRAYNTLYVSQNSNVIIFTGVGIEEEVQNAKFKVQSWPNPAAGIVDCRLPALTKEGSIVDGRYVSVNIYDMQGREVANVFEGQLPTGEYILQFDVSNLPQGIYLLRVIAGNHSAIKKIVII
jgi:hypothetical protein